MIETKDVGCAPRTGMTIFIIIVAIAILVIFIIFTPDDFERMERRMPQLVPQKAYAGILIPQAYLPAVFKFQPLDIVNPGFEGGQWQETAWCEEPCEVLRHDQFNEVRPPVGWTAWWRDGPSPRGRPEVGITIDPARVHSGEQALKWFTFWRTHHGGIAQQVGGVTLYIFSYNNYPLKHADFYVDDISAFFHPDGSLVVQLWMHSWYTDCDQRPYDMPYSKDCDNPLYSAHQYLNVCVDFNGGPVDPRHPWGGPCDNSVEQYGYYTSEPITFVVPCNDC